ncbi:MAG: hypothetical protein QM667_11995, partial [Asticcacaulis sp.]
MRCLLLTLFLLTVGSAQAQTLKPLPDVQETYTAGVKVSGMMFYGLRRGMGSRSLDLGDIRISMPAGTGDRLCLRMASRDGRYFREQSFETTGVKAGTQDLRLTSGFRSQLLAYDRGDVAVRAQFRADCHSGQPGRFAPAVFPGDENSSILRVYLNAKKSATRVVVLDASGQPLTEAGCTTFETGRE